MGLQNFQIFFDQDVFYPKQNVSGHVLVEVSSTKAFRCLKIKVRGEANTEWKVRHTSQHGTTEVTYSDHEEYFSTRQSILGSASANQRMEISSGAYTYPFKFTLPPDLPGSFEGKNGYIRYTVVAVIDKPWAVDEETERAFTVVGIFDLHREPAASERVNEEMRKIYCCLCCASRPLKIDVYIPVRGFVPDQEIPIRINIDNQSSAVVNAIVIRFQQVVIYHAKSPREDTIQELVNLMQERKGPISRNGSDCYEQILKVPKVYPTTSSEICKIIDVHYQLRIETDVSGWFSIPFVRDIPIFIGTIPISSFVTSIPINPSAPDEEFDQNIGNAQGFSTENSYAPMESATLRYSNYNPRSDEYNHDYTPNSTTPSLLERITACCSQSRTSKISTG